MWQNMQVVERCDGKVAQKVLGMYGYNFPIHNESARVLTRQCVGNDMGEQWSFQTPFSKHRRPVFVDTGHAFSGSS